MLEEFFIGLPLPVNILLAAGALFVVIRASHFLVDGAVHIAHEFNISPLIIGATVVAMGTSSAELAVNLVIVTGRGDTSAVAGNILGSNLVNFGIELGVAALIAGSIAISQEAFQKDVPLYFAAAGLLTAMIFDGQISRSEAAILLAAFIAALYLIIQYARAQDTRGILLVEVTELEAISHPTALTLTRGQALLALFGGLAVLVAASRLLVLNTAAIGASLHIPEFIIGLVIIGPGTSLPEIASSIQAARRGHGDLVFGTAFGSNLFNLLFGLGLPALIRPLAIGNTAIQSFIFMNVINFSVLALVLMDVRWLGKVRAITRPIGVYLIATYTGFIIYQIVEAVGGTFLDWLITCGIIAGATTLGIAGRQWIVRRFGKREAYANKILCLTRGGQASQDTHRRAIEIAQERDAELIFLYVFDPLTLPKAATPLVINPEAQIEHMIAFLEATACKQARLAGIPAKIVARTGNLREQVQAVANEEGVDLVIIGTPVGEGSLFANAALRTLAAEIEETTNASVLGFGRQHPSS